MIREWLLQTVGIFLGFAVPSAKYVIKRRVEMPDNLSNDLKDLILRLLEKDRSKRIRMNELRVSCFRWPCKMV